MRMKPQMIPPISSCFEKKDFLFELSSLLKPNLSRMGIRISKNRVAKMFLAAPTVKAGRIAAFFCAVKAKPHIIAAIRQSIGAIIFFISGLLIGQGGEENEHWEKLKSARKHIKDKYQL